MFIAKTELPQRLINPQGFYLFSFSFFFYPNGDRVTALTCSYCLMHSHPINVYQKPQMKLGKDVWSSIRSVIFTVTDISRKSNNPHTQKLQSGFVRKSLPLFEFRFCLYKTRCFWSNGIQEIGLLFDYYPIWLGSNNEWERFHQELKQWGSLITFGSLSSFLLLWLIWTRLTVFLVSHLRI